MTVADAIFPAVSAGAAHEPRRERVHTVETVGIEVVDSAPDVANVSPAPEPAPAPTDTVPFASTLRRVG